MDRLKDRRVVEEMDRQPSLSVVAQLTRVSQALTVNNRPWKLTSPEHDRNELKFGQRLQSFEGTQPLNLVARPFVLQLASEASHMRKLMVVEWRPRLAFTDK
jgi:hypothetical protein